MQKQAQKRSREQGAILITATIVIVVMLILALPFLVKLSAQYRTTEKSQDSLAAFNLAEAGVDRALWEMNRPFAVTENGILDMNAEGNGTLGPVGEQVGGLTGTIEGTVTTNLGVTPNTRSIVSTGRMPHIGNLTVDRTVGVSMEKYYKSIWDFGFFADEGFYVRTNLFTDSYDSRRGAYDMNNRGNLGHIGTNGSDENAFDVDQGSSSSVYGNIAAGVDSDPDNLTNIINLPDDGIFKSYDADAEPGSRRILSAPFEMPSVDLYSLPPRQMFDTAYDFSTWFTSAPSTSGPLLSSQLAAGIDKGGYSPGKGSFTLTAADSGVYTSFSLNKSNVTVSGHVALYVTGLDGATGQFYMSNNSSVTIAPDSSLTLILGKTTYYQANNTTINNTAAPENLIILGTDEFTGAMDYKCNSANKAAIYVPRAEFTVTNSNVDIYGAVVCRYFSFPVNINLHYDEALGNLDYVKGGIPYWKLTGWRERVGGE